MDKVRVSLPFFQPPHPNACRGRVRRLGKTRVAGDYDYKIGSLDAQAGIIDSLYGNQRPSH